MRRIFMVLPHTIFFVASFDLVFVLYLAWVYWPAKFGHKKRRASNLMLA
jgi:cbb3-type cytochrome oxidase subunit 3